jgi:hypothetical protein
VCKKELKTVPWMGDGIGMTCEDCVFRMANTTKYPGPVNGKNVLRIKGDGHAEVGF